MAGYKSVAVAVYACVRNDKYNECKLEMNTVTVFPMAFNALDKGVDKNTTGHIRLMSRTCSITALLSKIIPPKPAP